MFKTLVLCCVLPIIMAIRLSNIVQPNEISDLTDDQALTLTRIADNAGYEAESYEVVTEDGYILQLDRIAASPKNLLSTNKIPVLLVHGILDSSVTWVAEGPGVSLGYLLADQGYDVWLGNVRGNKYSRKHVNLTTSDAEYWMFSWNEMGIYDLPAMIDHIIKQTQQEKIFMVTHSQGGTSFFVMATERPEYQEKIIALSALAPAVFMSRAKLSAFQALSIATTDGNLISHLPGIYEVPPLGKTEQSFLNVICRTLMPVCEGIIDLLFGYDGNLNQNSLLLVTQYAPAGAGIRQFEHYGQSILSGKFRKFDYGAADNKQRYGREQPPDYNLGNVSVPVNLYYGTNDIVATPQDIQELYEILPNGQKSLTQIDSYAHVDFLWGNNVQNLVYEKILSSMEQQLVNEY